MVLGDHIGHDDPILGGPNVHIIGPQESRDAELAVSHCECVVEVNGGVVLIELLVVDEVRPVLLDEGVEGETIAPAGG